MGSGWGWEFGHLLTLLRGSAEIEVVLYGFGGTLN